MNIFYLHPNPRKCARWACDKHVVKMLLETCQLLYTCHWVLGSDLGTAPCRKGSAERGYKKNRDHSSRQRAWRSTALGEPFICSYQTVSSAPSSSSTVLG